MSGGKVWLITGASRGMGRAWAVGALERGDAVAATARDTATLADLEGRFGEQVLSLQLDVDDHDADVAAVNRARDHFGRLDVVVNNAGYGQLGMIEEIGQAKARAAFDTNVFGTLWVTQAALPIMREQGSGHLLQISSIGGLTAFRNAGMYIAGKWALEGMSQTLALEVARFGVRVTLVEPGPYATDWGGSSASRSAPLAVYDPVRRDAVETFARRMGPAGDPAATVPAVLELVDADDPPLRLLLGPGPLRAMEEEYAQRLATWRAWDDVACAAF